MSINESPPFGDAASIIVEQATGAVATWVVPVIVAAAFVVTARTFWSRLRR